jgi:CDP-diacylglycerol--serine O-phosphatidyltransferase
MSIKKHIPNLLTCCNLLCGCFAIVSAFKSELSYSAFYIGAALVFDFLDGFAARMLKVQSDIGKQLDSLADMVTFGLAPGMIMYHLLNKALIFNYGAWNIPVAAANLVYIAFLIPVFSALRLAKFNIDTRQTNSFIGVPTPANAIVIASFPLIMATGPKEVIYLLVSPAFLISVTVVMCFLMLAELPLFALKFKNFTWRDNKIQFIFIACCILLLTLFKFVALPLAIMLYVIFSFVHNRFASDK